MSLLGTSHEVRYAPSDHVRVSIGNVPAVGQKKDFFKVRVREDPPPEHEGRERNAPESAGSEDEAKETGVMSVELYLLRR